MIWGMKSAALITTFLLPIFCVLGADKKSKKNELKVKINHDYRIGSAGKHGALPPLPGKPSVFPGGLLPKKRGSKHTIQFNYDTREILQITNYPESNGGILLKRGEVKTFQALMDKMLEFADAVHQNKITGVRKKFKDKSLHTSLCRTATVNIAETADPTNKTKIRVSFSFDGYNSNWNYAELQELDKIFDDQQKEVFKKYDLLKALND